MQHLNQPKLQPNAFTPQVFFDKNTFIIPAVIPAILQKQAIYKAQRLEMLNNYRRYVQAYNDNIATYNEQVAKENAKVYTFIEQHNLHRAAAAAQENFKERIGKVSIYEYNKAATLTNTTTQKPIIPLLKHTKVAKSSEHIFALLLFAYAMQIDQKNNILERCGATTTRGIQKVEVNPYELANTVIDGVNTLPYHTNTIRNHITRLRDAGILINYEFRGHAKPVNYHINSAILEIFDEIPRKNINAENQVVKSEILQTLYHKRIDTRTIKDKNNIIVPVDNTAQLKELIKQLPSGNNKNINDKNTQEHVQKNTNQGPAAAENIPEITRFLETKIEDEHEFCAQLSKNHYKNYRFTHRKHFEHELYRGVMDADAFRELLIQTFIKISAPIWKDASNINAGCWYNAYQLINETMLINPNGSTPSKQVLMYQFDNLVYRITWAKRFYNKFENYRALYPSLYFDPTRKTKKSGGFAYTLNALKKHQVHHENRQKRKEALNKAANRRNYKYHAIELVERKIKAVKNNRATMLELCDYVSNNAHIPQEVKSNLPKYIERIFKN